MIGLQRSSSAKENAKDESRDISTDQNYKRIYFKVLDCARISIEHRFVPNKNILKDCSWIDPKKFKEIVQVDKFPEDVLCPIPNLCKVERSMLLKELKQFAAQCKSFVNIKETAKAQDKKRNEDKSEDEYLTYSSSSESDEKQSYQICQDDVKCVQCLPCAFSVIYELSQSGLF